MRVIVDNNIVSDATIKEIENSKIFESITKRQISLYPSHKFYVQLIPFLMKKNKKKESKL